MVAISHCLSNEPVSSSKSESDCIKIMGRLSAVAKLSCWACPWRRYTRLLPKDCAVLGIVTIAGDDHGALVRLASTGALVKVTGGEVTMLNQSRVRMKLDLLERQQHSPELEIVEWAKI
jgi:hypothetical protein